MTLYAHQLTKANGTPANTTQWTYVRSECRDPATTVAEPHKKQRRLTWHDVRTAIRRIGPPAATVHAPHYTLVNLDTTFYTTPTTINRTLTLLHHTLDIHITADHYTWHWGDGTSTTTTTPGHPYPATDITHTWHHATNPQAPLTLRVDTTYTARYRVHPHTTWHTIPTPLTITGTPTPLTIKQASAVLTRSSE
ncbi:MAG: hypothetical protein ACRDQA_11645 [Nocardioidaceae bacterium]